MIDHFPTPYPDELLYSLLARHHLRRRSLSAQDNMDELFGGGRKTAIIDLPTGLQALCDHLGSEATGLTPLGLIENHSLWPFYRSFLTTGQRDQTVRDMVGNGGRAVHGRSGTLAGRVPDPPYLRFCPSCRRLDVRTWGEPYWHRMHQLPGVLVCCEHGEPLCESPIPWRQRTHRQRPMPLLASTPGRRITTIDSLEQAHLGALARYAKILFQRDLGMGLVHWRDYYQAQLQMKDLALFGGRVRQSEFRAAFEGYFGNALLVRLQCAIPPSDGQWLSKLVRKPTHSNHPLHHLLLWCFLQAREDELGVRVPHDSPFGVGPWPCLNRAAPHYRERTITAHRQWTYRGTVIGEFACRCGFTYCWRRPDLDIAVWDRPRRILAVGDVWLAQLDALTTAGCTLRAMGRALGVDPTTVRRYQHRQTLEVAPSVTRNQDVGLRDTAREEWIAALDRKGTPARARADRPGLYAWLYRNDYQWLMNCSARQRRDRKSAPGLVGVHWDERDRHMAPKVAKAARTILAKEPPVRVSKATVARLVDPHDWLRRQPDRLPRTMAVLHPYLEDATAYRRRRLYWAATKLRSQGQTITRSSLCRVAGIRSPYEATVTNDLDRLVGGY